MDEFVYNALLGYFNALEATGQMSSANSDKLLVLSFYVDYTMHDYRGIISKEDYRLISQALDCLYGSTCLIPYPDYLKMSKLRLGQMSEMAQRIANLENTNVLSVISDNPEDTTTSDIVIKYEEE